MALNIGGSNQGNLKGDGIAIGAGNTVVIHKNRITNNNRGASSGSGDEGGVAIALGVVVAIAVALLAFYFARYAELFYAILLGTTLIEAVTPLVSLCMQIFYRIDGGKSFKEPFTLVLASTTALLAYRADMVYPHDLTYISMHSAGMKMFWCTLAPYGHVMAAQGAVGAIGLALISLLLLPHAASSLIQYFVDPNGRVCLAINKMASTPVMAFAAILVISTWAFMSYGGDYMKDLATTVTHFLCPRP